MGVVDVGIGEEEKKGGREGAAGVDVIRKVPN